MVSMVLLFTLTMVSAQAETLPLFFKSTYGDARDEVARQGRKFNIDDPAWQPIIKPGLSSCTQAATAKFCPM